MRMLTQAPVPVQVIDKGLLPRACRRMCSGPSTRTACPVPPGTIFERAGIAIARSTLAAWSLQYEDPTDGRHRELTYP